MLSTIAHILFNPGLLITAVVTAAILAGCWFGLGPVKFMQVVANWRTWAAVAAVALCASLFSLQHRAEHAEQQAQGAQEHTQAASDTSKVLTQRIQKKTVRAAENTRLEKAIQDAKPGDQVDSVMDEIARIQCGDPANRARPDCLRDGAGQINP